MSSLVQTTLLATALFGSCMIADAQDDSGAAGLREPIFHFRVLINSFRKDPANTPARVAADAQRGRSPR